MLKAVLNWYCCVGQAVGIASDGPAGIRWSAWRREGAFGLAPAGLWVAVFRVTQRRATRRRDASPPVPVESLAGRMVWSGTAPTSSPAGQTHTRVGVHKGERIAFAQYQSPPTRENRGRCAVPGWARRGGEDARDRSAVDEGDQSQSAPQAEGFARTVQSRRVPARLSRRRKACWPRADSSIRMSYGGILVLIDAFVVMVVNHI